MAAPAGVGPVVSERGYSIGGRWYLCTQASVVIGAHNADPMIPATALEARRIYALSGHADPNHGTTQADLLNELAAAYGHRPATASSYPNALAALRTGAILAVAGDYGRLPRTPVDFPRWDVPFWAEHGQHEVPVGPIAAGDNSIDPLVWWRDPLATEGYAGEWIHWSAVVTFADSPSRVLIFPKGAWSMARNFTVRSWSPINATIKADSPHYGVPIDGRTTWPLLVAGDVYEGLPIKLDTPVAGGLPGEDRADGSLAMVASVACIILDKDADLAPATAGGDGSYLVRLTIKAGVPAITPA